MSKRISKRVREEAAVLCALMASSNRDVVSGSFLFDPADPFPSSVVQADFGEPCAALGVSLHGSDGAADLARQALWYLTKYPSADEEIRVDWAEAESLLRCGWSPGDEP